MFAEFFDETYLISADVDDGYIDYLKGHHGVYASSRSLLRLKCTGPFQILRSKHIVTMSLLALGLTVQESEELFGGELLVP